MGILFCLQLSLPPCSFLFLLFWTLFLLSSAASLPGWGERPTAGQLPVVLVAPCGRCALALGQEQAQEGARDG